MSDLPERIWAWNFIPDKQDDIIKGGWDDVFDRKLVEYIRADLSPQWQTIETFNQAACDHGYFERVQLFCPPYGAGSGNWNGNRWNCHFCLNKEAQPTHWMPLPKPPT